MSGQVFVPLVVVAAGIIEERGLILIAKRQKGSHLAGFWEFPGGKQEGGESLPQCLRREIREELGIHIEKPIWFATVKHRYPDKWVEIHFYRCFGFSGEPKALGCAEFAWVTREQIEDYPFPEADQTVLRQLSSVKEG